MQIVTITLSPALDVHCTLPTLELGKETLVTSTLRCAGGKGINLSRALTVNGVANTAVAVLGEENGREFAASLLAEGLNLLPLYVPGRIRENLTLHPETGKETRISFPGFAVPGNLLARVRELLPKLERGDVITLTGRIPAGVKVGEVTAFLRSLKAQGALVVVDSGNYPLEEIRALHPFLIKPNQEEVSRLCGREIDAANAPQAAKPLTGVAEQVLVTLGGDGAVLFAPEGVYAATFPPVPVCSTVGAGDSTIAGFLAGLARGLSTGQVLALALSYGTAACLREGTLPPLPQDVERLLPAVSVRRI